MYRRFDIVRLLTTKNVKFLSGPLGRPENPEGNWSVVGIVPGSAYLLVAKGQTIASVPISDIIHVATYDIQSVIDGVRKVKSTKDLEELRNAKEYQGRWRRPNSGGNQDST